MLKGKPFRTFLKALTAGTVLMMIPSSAWTKERILLDFTMQTLPPADWAAEGHAFGARNPVPNESGKNRRSPRKASVMPSKGA